MICGTILHHAVHSTSGVLIEVPQTWKIHLVFYTSFLQLFQTSTWTISNESSMDELELEEDDRSYEVEKLL